MKKRETTPTLAIRKETLLNLTVRSRVKAGMRPPTTCRPLGTCEPDASMITGTSF